MEQVGELSDWIWLIVALIWVAVQIVPRLFRSESKKSAERLPSRPEPSAVPQGPPEMLRNADAKPIEPR